MSSHTQLDGSAYSPVLSSYVLPRGCDLYVNLRDSQGLRCEPDSDTYATVTSGSLRFQTRLFRKSNSPVWNEVFIFTCEDLLLSDQKVTFEVWWDRRWAAATLIGHVELDVAALDLAHAGITLNKNLQLQMYDRSGAPRAGEYGMLSITISVLYTAPDAGMVSEVRAGKLEKQYWMIINGADSASEGAPKAVEVPVEASSAAMMVRPRVTVAGTSNSAPSITHSAAGTLYEQPCVCHLRLTLQRVGGLRNLPFTNRGSVSPAARPGIPRTTSIRQTTVAIADKLQQQREVLQRTKTEIVSKTTEFFNKLRHRKTGDEIGTGTGLSVKTLWAVASATYTAAVTSASYTATAAHLAVATAPATIASKSPDTALTSGVSTTEDSPENSEGWIDTQSNDGTPAAQVAVEAESTDGTEAEQVAELVNNKLESIGFTTTETPGGNFCYIKLLFEGQTCVSNITSHSEGIASWGQSLLFAAMRPLRNSPVEVEVYMCPERKSRGKLACRFHIPLFELLAEQMDTSNISNPSSTAGPCPARTVFQPRTFASQTADGHPMDVQMKAEVVDGDVRPQRYRLPLCAGSRDVLWEEEEEDASAGTNGDDAELLSPATASPETQSSALSFSSLSKAPSPRISLSNNASPGDASGSNTTASAVRTPSIASSSSSITQQAAAALEPNGAKQLGVLGQLLLTIHNFEVEKVSDCFCVFHCGNYWGSSTSVNVSSGAHDWEVRLPVADPSEVLTVALFRGENKVGDKKAKKSLFYDNSRMVGKLRVRLSTLLPGRCCKCRLPLISERTERKGVTIAGWANISLKVHYHDVFQHLRSYLQPAMHKPAVLLCLALDLKPDDLELPAAKIAMRWLQDCCPPIPTKVGRKVIDDGRQEFSLNRTKQNWLRVASAIAKIKPMRRWLEQVASWQNPLESASMVLGIILLGMYPSKVVALLFFWAVVQLLLYRHRSGTYGLPAAMMEDLPNPNTSRPEEPVPHLQPVDPYSVLKAQYDALVAFMMRVQNTLDTLATNAERLQMLLTWQDPVASTIFCCVLVVAGLGVWILSLRLIFCFCLAWAFRPPFLRDPYPGPPNNFMAHLPSNSDLMM